MRKPLIATIGLIVLPAVASGQVVGALLYISSQDPASARGVAYVCDPPQGNPPCLHPTAANLSVRFCVDTSDTASVNCFDAVANSAAVVPGTSHGYSSVIPAIWRDGAVHTLHAFVRDPVTLLWAEQQSSPESFQFDLANPGTLLPRFAFTAPDHAHAVAAEQVGLLINDDDAYSTAVGAYYQTQRGIPAANVRHVSLGALLFGNEISRASWESIVSPALATLPPSVQFLEIAWTIPSAVLEPNTGVVNSVTAMATYGWTPLAWTPNGNPSERIALLEGPTSIYFNSATRAPRTTYNILPAMLLAAKDAATAQALVGRSIAADGAGSATTNSYVVRSVDLNRGIRGWIYPPSLIGGSVSPYTTVTYKIGVNGLNDPSNTVTNQSDVLYLATGMASIEINAGNTWAPGGSADAPTSTSGYFVANMGNEVNACFAQTCATWFISQGAYGTCGNTGAEPATLRKKWPVPDLWMQCMVSGQTLGECYNKSIESPYQNNLVGDFMTQPYAEAAPPTPTATPATTPTATIAAAECPALPSSGCGSAGINIVSLRNPADPSRRKFWWKWRRGAAALTQNDFGDPANGGTAYTMCLYDYSGGAPSLKMRATIPSGGPCGSQPCWTAASTSGWSYRNHPGSGDGVTKARLQGGAAGAPSIKLIAAGASLPLPVPFNGMRFFQADPQVVIQLHRNDAPQCWTSAFAVSGTTVNDASRFKAKASF
jgi:uncharacterized protein (TIGR03790 family)